MVPVKHPTAEVDRGFAARPCSAFRVFLASDVIAELPQDNVFILIPLQRRLALTCSRPPVPLGSLRGCLSAELWHRCLSASVRRVSRGSLKHPCFVISDDRDSFAVAIDRRSNELTVMGGMANGQVKEEADEKLNTKSIKQYSPSKPKATSGNRILNIVAR